MGNLRLAAFGAFFGCIGVCGSIALGAEAQKWDQQLYVLNDTNHWAWVTVYRYEGNNFKDNHEIDGAYCVAPYTTSHSGHRQVAIKKVRVELRREAGCHGPKDFDNEAGGAGQNEAHYVIDSKGAQGKWRFFYKG